MKQRCLRKVAIAASAFACTTVLSVSWSEQGHVSLSIESAQARVGRPLTPMSVAGVARRHTRRAVYGAGIGGAAYYGAYGSNYGSYAAYGGGETDAVAYCTQRFRSYDPGSGTYLGYDGLRHACP
jgi:BA14K-like protein